MSRHATELMGILAALASGGAPPTGSSASTLRALLDGVGPGPATEHLRPPDLVARPAREEAWPWHRDRLVEAIEGTLEGDNSRIAYHASWLRHLCSPRDTAALPTVSIVIPVWNRAGLLREAVASAIAQTYSAARVVVIDDGSTDGPESAIAAWRERVLYLRQPNRGVASARNRGIRSTRSDFVLLLDSDDLLDPDYTAACVAAFAHVPDADYCYCVPREEGRHGERLSPAVPRDGDRAARDLLSAALRGGHLVVPGTMIARFRLLQVGGFDERLRQGEDSRLRFRLGLVGAKAVGLCGDRNLVRHAGDGLSENALHERAHCARTHLMNLVDLVESPRAWSYIPEALGRFRQFERWAWVTATDEPLVASRRQRLLTALELLDTKGPRGAIAPEQVRDWFRQAVEELDAMFPEVAAAGGSFHRRLTGLLGIEPAGSRPSEPGTMVSPRAAPEEN
jgi:glycosyltransferase involved in cell wall biosynthesis